MSDFIDDFLNQLEQDKPKPRTDFSRLAKLTMSAQDNQGTVLLAPFKDPKTSKFYSIITGVREIKTPISIFHEGNDDVWVKILPLENYGGHYETDGDKKTFVSSLTTEQQNLYNEVAGMFDQYYEMVDANEKMNTWDLVRFRSYSLFQGIILSHSNASGASIKDHENVAALLIYPSKGPISAMSDAIASKIANSKGSKSWLPAVFSPNASGREGALSIQFIRKTDNQPGYNVAVAFEFNSSFNTVIDPDMKIAQEVLDLFGDFNSEFLGWENGEDSAFNDKLFQELKKILMISIKSLESKPATPKTENQNGKDPMIDATPSTDPEPTPTQTPTEEPKGDFPF